MLTKNGRDGEIIIMSDEEEAAVRAQWAEWDAGALQRKRDPASMSAMSFRLALEDAQLLDQAETLVADNATPKRIKIMWEYASSFDRMNPDLIAMAQGMGLTDEQVDAVFGIV